jgi:hypothetical protein
MRRLAPTVNTTSSPAASTMIRRVRIGLPTVYVFSAPQRVAGGAPSSVWSDWISRR